jgi:hypothetical protein
MSISCFFKLCAVAAIFSLVGYYAFPFISITGTPETSIFATGILIGTIFGGLLVALYPSSSNASDNSSNILYVGNIPFNAREDEVQRLFETYGTVKDVRLVTGGYNKRPKGYGFVEMDAKGAKEALALNGTEFGGRKLRVNKAKSKAPRS